MAMALTLIMKIRKLVYGMANLEQGSPVWKQGMIAMADRSGMDIVAILALTARAFSGATTDAGTSSVSWFYGLYYQGCCYGCKAAGCKFFLAFIMFL